MSSSVIIIYNTKYRLIIVFAEMVKVQNTSAKSNPINLTLILIINSILFNNYRHLLTLSSVQFLFEFVGELYRTL